MTPREDMVVRMAVDFHQQDQRVLLKELIDLAEKHHTILQDIIQFAQEEFPDCMSDGLRAAIRDAKLSIVETDEAVRRARAALARGVQ